MTSPQHAGPNPGHLDEDLPVIARRNEIDAKLRSLVGSAALPASAPGLGGLSLPHRSSMAGDELHVLHELFLATEKATASVVERILPAPLLAARRVNLALDRVQAATTLTDVLRTVPSELCWAGDFDRVLFSRVDESSWIPATWFTTQPEAPNSIAFGRLVHGACFTLSNGSLEAEIVRRRVTALVTDAADESRTFAPLLDVAECPSYVIAPVISGDAVVGLLHADAATSGRPLGQADRVTLRAFADGVGLILERLALVDALEAQRVQIGAALARAAQLVDELADSPMVLGASAVMAATPHSRDEARQPADGLTVREREVFALLVSGATNAEIADRLTVSETTVKSHVKHILRKMRVSNRAEAIAKYLRGTHRSAVSS